MYDLLSIASEYLYSYLAYRETREIWRGRMSSNLTEIKKLLDVVGDVIAITIFTGDGESFEPPAGLVPPELKGPAAAR